MILQSLLLILIFSVFAVPLLVRKISLLHIRYAQFPVFLTTLIFPKEKLIIFNITSNNIGCFPLASCAFLCISNSGGWLVSYWNMFRFPTKWKKNAFCIKSIKLVGKLFTSNTIKNIRKRRSAHISPFCGTSSSPNLPFATFFFPSRSWQVANVNFLTFQMESFRLSVFFMLLS